jgi:hypothetical protein
VKLGSGVGKLYVHVDNEFIPVRGDFTARLQLLVQLHYVLRLNYDSKVLAAFRILEHCYGLVTEVKDSMVVLKVISEALKEA